ncbi:DUF4198 domain-containing protein [Ideonella livida]|uniref:DUF4198 domain-containing protein n=1 Tax=Ideonella livida TaxID=2707176 RepID=A0A7C9PKE9_9BURK|nr:DUF4198 domain-containing protein [Ideonella livida]NDY93989.1 DUF4198 domain-containing protein [Ideonella livida]
MTARPLSPALRTLALIATLGTLPAAQAHMTWILPNASHLDGKEATVSVDAAVSEDLFHFDRALKLDTLVITGPDGQPREAENLSAARHRSSFDLKLVQDGTYRLSHVSRGLMGSWKQGSETKRFRGTAESFAKEVPAQAEILSLTATHTRHQTFVSKEQTGPLRFQPEGQGLEVLPLGPVTDLSAGDTTRLQLLFNGQPLPGASLKLLRDGNRYRYKLGEQVLTSDAQGVVTLAWAEAGRYYLAISHGDRPPAPPAGATPSTGPSAAPPAPAPGSAGTRDKPLQRASLAVTFEVLPR